MIKARYNVFETNSSSTHSIVICTKKQFEDWKNGYITFNPYRETFSDALSDEEKTEIRKNAPDKYNSTHDSKFYKTWSELDGSVREEYIQSCIKEATGSDDNNHLSYEYYKSCYNAGCYYTEKYFKTKHGDEVVAFGKGGYDG